MTEQSNAVPILDCLSPATRSPQSLFPSDRPMLAPGCWYDRGVRILLILSALICAAGCRVSDNEKATLVGPLRAQNDAYLLRIQQAVGPTKFHPHALVFGRSLAVHTLWLAYAPTAARTTYSWKEVKIEAMTSTGALQELQATAGTVTIDRVTESVTVRIDTASAAFTGNGDYPLKIQSR